MTQSTPSEEQVKEAKAMMCEAHLKYCSNPNCSSFCRPEIDEQFTAQLAQLLADREQRIRQECAPSVKGIGELKNEFWHEQDCPAHSNNMDSEGNCYCLMSKACEVIDQAVSITRAECQQEKLEAVETAKQVERKLWADCFKRCHDREKLRAFTKTKETLLGLHKIKWKMLYEALSEAVMGEVDFPGETDDGRCPKCDDKRWCAYCQVHASLEETQQNILDTASCFGPDPTNEK
jgi:hypothetical protein